MADNGFQINDIVISLKYKKKMTIQYEYSKILVYSRFK